MRTQCNAEQLEFSGVERRRVVAAFDGGTVSSDAGALLLGKADEAIGLIQRLADCFTDERRADLIQPSRPAPRSRTPGRMAPEHPQ